MAALLRSSFFYMLLCLAAPNSLGQVSEQHAVFVPSDTATLVVVYQVGIDISVYVVGDDGAELTIDSHIGRTGPEIFLLESLSGDTNYQITIEGESSSDYEMEFHTVSLDSDSVNAAKAITAAASLEKTTDPEKMQLALEFYEEASTTASDISLESYARFMQGVLSSKLADYGKAITVLESLEQLPLFDNFRYRKSWLQGEILFSQDRYEEARAALEKSLIEIANYPEKPEHTDLDKADIMITLGFTKVLTGAVNSGKNMLDAALVIGEEYSNNKIIGRAYNNLGGYYSVQQDLANAASSLNSAVDFLSDSADIQTLIYALSNLSMTYRGMGRYQLARESAHLALSKAEQGTNPTHLAAAYTGLASLYLRMGEYRMAEEFARMSRQIDIKTDREWRSNTLMNMEADAVLGQERPLDAIEIYNTTTEYFRKNGPTSRFLTNLQRLTRAYLDANDLENAEQTLAKAKSLMESNSQFDTESSSWVIDELEATLLLDKGHPRQAIAIMDRAFAQEIDYVLPQHVTAADLLMRAYSVLEEYEQAVRYGELAVEYISTIRSRLEYARLGPAWSKETYPVFLRTVDNLLSLFEQSRELGHATRAFEIVEQSQAFNLARQRESSLFNNEARSEESQKLLNELTRLGRQRASLASREGDPALDLEYFKILERYQASLDLEYSTYEPKIQNVEMVQRELPDGTAFIQFVCVPDSRCFRFLITKDKFDIATVGTFSDIQIYALALQTQLRNPSNREATAAARLGALLFDSSMLTSLGSTISNLNVVTSYPLDSVPLAALEFEENGRFSTLVNRFAISTLPSAESLSVNPLQASRVFEHELAVMADPVFDEGNALQIAAVEMPTDDTLRGWYNGLERLPWSAREAESLIEIFSGENIRTMIGTEANRDNLLDEATRNSRVVHIASHGYFNQATPDLVGIATSPRGGGSGFVTLEELLMHPFHSELVVISGCETGLGQSRGGEGMMSLSRAFLGQGVNHVISTQWPVSDRASAEFMRLFYRALDLDQMNVAQALRSAQLQLSSNPRYRAPFYWAPYVLTSIGS